MLALAATALIGVVSVGAVVATIGEQRRNPPLTPPPAPTPTLLREPENAVERLVVLLKQRQAARRALSFLSVLLLLGAGAFVGYPFFTNLQQSRLQGELDRQLASPEIQQAYRDGAVAIGDSLTRIIIPSIDVDMVVVEGTTASALRAGAGHYPSTPLPCSAGNVGIAGHRTTYGRPFHDVDLLEPGDEIILETPVGRCVYVVDVDPFIVTPNDVSVVANTPGESRLTLTSCHPKGSARQRIIITAELVENETDA